MNASELTAKVSSVTGINRKTVEQVLKTTAGIAALALHEGAEVALPGIGKIAVKQTLPRVGRNPKTGEPLDIPARKKPTFKPAKQLVEVIAS